jgi:uncharacterized protein (UPF0303 family)
VSQEDLLRKLEAEMETLRFESFNFDDALAIGLDLVETGRRKALPIAIDVTVNQQQLFHAALPGSSPDNDQWVLRKGRVAARFFKSSLAIATELRIKGKTIEEVHDLRSTEYAPSGRSVRRRQEIAVHGVPTGTQPPWAADAYAASITRWTQTPSVMPGSGSFPSKTDLRNR